MMSGVPELTIDTLDGRVAVPDSWLAFVARELREPDRYVVVKDGRRHSYAQVFNDEGTLLLEYRDGSPSVTSRWRAWGSARWPKPCRSGPGASVGSWTGTSGRD